MLRFSPCCPTFFYETEDFVIRSVVALFDFYLQSDFENFYLKFSGVDHFLSKKFIFGDIDINHR